MRKLATAALAFSAAIFLANYIPSRLWLFPAALAALAGGAAVLLLRRKWLRPAAVALLFFALGLFEFRLYSGLTVERAAGFAGETREVSGVLLDYPDVYDSYCRLRIRVDSSDLPHFKAIVYDNDKSLTAVEPGQKLRFTAKFSTADTVYGQPYDNYHVDGFYWKLSIKSETITEDRGFELQSIPVRLRHALCRRVDSVFPQDVSPFLKALMLGDKQDFYQDDALYVSMSRAGLMHVAAVSGLHIAFLVSLLVFLLGRGRKSALVCIALVWGFVLITGSSPSAVRAAFMQTLLLLAPVLRRENDPVTSLSAALAMILAACPWAAKSVSLQMSFSSMAGIIFFFEPIYRALTRRLPKGRAKKPLSDLCAVLASSVSVMVFSFPLTALHFSYVPLLSVLSNIACIWAVSLCFCGAWIACALAGIPLLGVLSAWLCTAMARYILAVARMVAAFPYSVLYMKTGGAFAWMLFCYAMLALWALLKRKKRVFRLLPAALALLALVLIFWRADSYYRRNDTFSVLDVGQGQCVTAFAGDATLVIDCGNISSIENAGAVAGEYLRSCGRNSIEILMLTHLHEDHADGVTMLMEMLPVDTLILPADADRSAALYNEIIQCAQIHGTSIVELDGPAQFQCGRILLDVFKHSDRGDENERCLMARVSVGETDMLVTGDVSKKLERRLTELADLSGTEILVVGHHGSRYACSEELLAELGGGLAVVSSGYNNYGHPAEETLERLREYGYNVLRTDESGTIEILAG